MPKGPEDKTRSTAIDQFIYELRAGKQPTNKGATKTPAPHKKSSGPIKFSDPVAKSKSDKLIDYTKIEAPKLYPNQVKLNIKENEDRFPKEAKVPNYKKYDSKGNYIKHKPKIKAERTSKVSTNQVIKQHLLSSSNKRRPKISKG